MKVVKIELLPNLCGKLAGVFYLEEIIDLLIASISEHIGLPIPTISLNVDIDSAVLNKI